MSKRSELKTVAGIIKGVLLTDMRARSDDMYLYYRVCYQINPHIENMNASYFLKCGARYLNYPTFETVRRARQKIQHNNPDLSGSKVCEAARRELEEEFRAFAKGS